MDARVDEQPEWHDVDHRDRGDASLMAFTEAGSGTAL